MLHVMNPCVTPMRVYVNPEVCIGCEVCEIVCPEVFRMQETENGRVAVAHTEWVPDDAQCFCKDARDCCKPGAITLVPAGRPGTDQFEDAALA